MATRDALWDWRFELPKAIREQGCEVIDIQPVYWGQAQQHILPYVEATAQITLEIDTASHVAPVLYLQLPHKVSYMKSVEHSNGPWHVRQQLNMDNDKLRLYFEYLPNSRYEPTEDIVVNITMVMNNPQTGMILM